MLKIEFVGGVLLLLLLAGRIAGLQAQDDAMPGDIPAVKQYLAPATAGIARGIPLTPAHQALNPPSVPVGTNQPPVLRPDHG